MSDENEVETPDTVTCVNCGSRASKDEAKPCHRCLDWQCVGCIDMYGVVCQTCIEGDGE